MRISEPAFDAYHASVCTVADLLTDGIADALGATRIEGRTPRNGYAHARGIFRGDDHLCDVMHGGHNPLPFLTATGQNTPEVVESLRRLYPEHSVARADAKYDLDGGPGTWEHVHQVVSGFAEQKRLKSLYIESSGDPRADEPVKASTFYIGSHGSRNRSRSYCKGLELLADGVNLEGTGYTPHTVRHEIQVRPTSQKKAALAVVTPDQLFGACPWSRSLVNDLLGLSTGRLHVGAPKHQNDLDRRLESCLKMYGRTMLELLDREGSPEALGRYLSRCLG